MFIGRFGAYVRYVNTEEREDVHSTLSNWSWGLILDDVALCLPLRWKFPGCNGWRWSSRCPKWRLLALQGQAVLIKSLGSINPMICKGSVLHFPNERQPTIALARRIFGLNPRPCRLTQDSPNSYQACGKAGGASAWEANASAHADSEGGDRGDTQSPGQNGLQLLKNVKKLPYKPYIRSCETVNRLAFFIEST